MSVAKIKHFPQNPVGMASNKPFVVPSLRDLIYLYLFWLPTLNPYGILKSENHSRIDLPKHYAAIFN